MTRKSFLSFVLFFISLPLLSTFGHAQTANPSSNLFDPQAAAAPSREDQLYSAGTSALDSGNYDDAVRKFDEAAGLHGRKADAALYWKAYALNKTGNKPAAQATIADLRKSYPQSRWLRDAGALELEMKGAPANPEAISDEELKLLALQSLMNADPDKAVPILDKIIHGNDSPKLKDKALFVLSQSGSDKAQQILLSLAKANNNPELQKRAIHYIGMGGSRNNGTLREIYKGTTDVSIKKAVFQGWLMSGDKEDVLAVARTEQSPELRKEAIRYLGMMGGRSELREMYKNSPDAGTREAVIHGMLMAGDSQGLIEITNTEKDPELLDKAINTLGMVGGEDSLSALTNIYNTHNDIATKKRVINAMFLHGAAHEMVAMARKETNPELKRTWIQKLSVMSSPEITEYMTEILNK
ncbi:MAG TPA: tetratricopeptide repeat protein [Candidatus Acidoferrales bacterium]|jgi:tetratricopeptide (TPR) repeat protein|nr:tetratricopeptide repeat protein [Candidatus Acidoferrales bacterium]